MRTSKESVIINSFKQAKELNLPITIGGSPLSREEVVTLLSLLEPTVPTTHVVHSVDISNVRELLQAIEEFNARPRNTNAR